MSTIATFHYADQSITVAEVKVDEDGNIDELREIEKISVEDFSSLKEALNDSGYAVIGEWREGEDGPDDLVATVF
ncbi:hypothetical protein E3_2000 [Rhodococcus phage E3]|uniref:hypothetical protein n=1 Tax=Rhodococcus phage E3 TaxID=1007869 RepID=UPI0002C69913|nr:hypothetical protein M176_gp212 [Rhodococcus phage E3]AEQ21120.1 hypothetical protein E3_2000 [Rhodococcus phage E3]